MNQRPKKGQLVGAEPVAAIQCNGLEKPNGAGKPNAASSKKKPKRPGLPTAVAKAQKLHRRQGRMAATAADEYQPHRDLRRTERFAKCKLSSAAQVGLLVNIDENFRNHLPR